MSNPKYLRNDLKSLLGHVVEECGEVLAAIGKTQRWGLESWNPEVLPGLRETNRVWLLRELEDLELTISRLRKKIAPKAPPEALSLDDAAGITDVIRGAAAQGEEK